MQLTNEWIEKGVKKGVRQDRQEGRRELVLRLLQRRVGTLPTKLAEEVDRLDNAAMFALGDALLDFRSCI